ncbi:I78 family peptidase inhibitor [uncultured Paracoccus sp.]|uniref:I78 family peptidase inhibitor n=1 Tax=uncultured Paracoccus sp. TaxID=189685 RepID=UPI0025F16E73|nr:I78 family peptidase inhibitor [uncultured Paracoccus sp.]
MRRYLALIPFALLAACEPAPTATPPEDETTDACGASGFSGLEGQPESVLDQMRFPAGTRVIRPNQAITMDYRIDRLNIEIGANGRIDKVSCY